MVWYAGTRKGELIEGKTCTVQLAFIFLVYLLHINRPRNLADDKIREGIADFVCACGDVGGAAGANAVIVPL